MDLDKFIEGHAVSGIGELHCENCNNFWEVMGRYEFGVFNANDYQCPDCGEEGV